MKIKAIILTFDESLHLERCIKSLLNLTSDIYIIDSYSNDSTENIAKSYNTTFSKNKFTNQANQFNWALGQINDFDGWILRIDADEYLSDQLIKEIELKLKNEANENVKGFYLKRLINFQGKLLKYGDASIKLIRLFKFGYGKSENRWMDEHIIVNGDTEEINKGYIIDHNLNSLKWWIKKHQDYSSREVIELLDLKFKFISKQDKDSIHAFQQNQKRFIKENIYYNFPIFLRALIYFLYRYLIKLGFLDGFKGLAFHFLQGFWYRSLVDFKYLKVRLYMKKNNVSLKKAINQVLNINIV